ncbi:aminotransferase class I/II-fold pyridoxal phosphate-dependent enzyme [Candidatus Poribacteria bacterium]|nr:aminotransferase class I/II-fold pyridoxal phosphate-dependent enzyme [Candidatus Poribacteria bacterium]
MAKLAINGGDKAVNRNMGREWPIRDENEEKALIEVIKSARWWGGGEGSKVWEFEDAFAKYQDAKYGVTTNSGTQALICALKAAGVEPCDEVLVPSLSFFASATCVLFINAIPVFVDVDPNTYGPSAESMEAVITERTKAAVIVHNGGYPANMDAIVEVSRKHDLPIIEDCAHAHASEWRGTRVGAIGHLGAFSLMAGKSLAGGEGGIILTNHPELREKLYAYMDLGRWVERPDKSIRLPSTSNFRMPEWTAAVLLTQLSKLDEQVEIRERNFTYLAEGLKDIDGIEPFERDPRVTRWSIYYWNFKYIQEKFDGIPRDKFLAAIGAEGVPASVGAHGRPIYQNPLFQSMTDGKTWPVKCPDHYIDYTKTHCPEAERIFKTEAICISHRYFLGDISDMDLIIDAVKKVRANTDELR